MLKLFKFYSPDDVNNGGIIEPLNAEKTFELLDTDDDDPNEDDIKLDDKKDDKKKEDKSDKKDDKQTKENKKDDKEKEDDDSESDDELDEIEKDLDEDDEPDEDDLELVSPVRRKEILAKYPKIFEDFPYLEKAYYREQKYTEIFPSLDDARTAVEKSQTLDDFEKKILTGDTSTILKTVKEENEEAFNTLVDNYLPNLQKVDREAYFHVIGSIIKGTVSNMVRSANSSKDKESAEALSNAAEILYKYVYGETEWTPHKSLSKGTKSEDNDETQKLSKEREDFNRERFETAKTELNTRIDKTLKKAIEKYIDPKESMTDFVRKSATREAYEEVNKILAKDSRFRAVLDKAWQKAASKGFNPESMDAVRKVVNSRAQTVLPAVIKKARIEALRGMGKSVRTSDKSDDNNSSGRSTSSTNRGPLKDRQSNNRGANNNNKQEIPKGMSNKDFLMSD